MSKKQKNSKLRDKAPADQINAQLKTKESRQKTRRWNFIVKFTDNSGDKPVVQKRIHQDMAFGNQEYANGYADLIERTLAEIPIYKGMTINVLAVGSETISPQVMSQIGRLQDQITDAQQSAELKNAVALHLALGWISGVPPLETDAEKLVALFTMSTLKAREEEQPAAQAGEPQVVLTEELDVEEPRKPFVPEIIEIGKQVDLVGSVQEAS